VDFNARHPELEKLEGYEKQSILEYAATCSDRADSSEYSRAESTRQRSRSTLLDCFEQYNLDALVFPGQQTTMAAKAGFPQVS
jgi:hypothetical protein